MERYYHVDAVVSDVAEALEQALGRHGLQTFHPLAVCAMLEVIASPLKAQVAGSPLMAKVGLKGVDTYLASRLPGKVEALKSPHSLIVNPLMDAVAAALAKKGNVPKERLFREALKVHLGLSGRPKSEIDEAMEKQANLDAALGSALADPLPKILRHDDSKPVLGAFGMLVRTRHTISHFVPPVCTTGGQGKA